MAGTKFYGSTSTFLLSVAAFISLSGYTTASDGRQCYWCGPLAEQVHRSRRAPPCDAPRAHVTTCDPGYLHCAVVATAPPYIESRYCVKIYQDECYLDFCNSTKTWKMTCPCKGDLCNGQNSDREDKAFAELLEKTQKSSKKRTKKSVNDTMLAPTQSDADNTISYLDANSSVIEIKHTENFTNDIYEKEFITHIKVENIVDESDPAAQLEREEFVTTTSLLVSRIHDQSKFENTVVHNNDYTTMNDMGQSDPNIHVEITTPMFESAIKKTDVNKNETPVSGNLVKPSEKLPTAEALQENANADANESPQEATTLIDEIGVTTDSTETTTENSTIRKNYAIRVQPLNLKMFAILFIIYKTIF